MLPKRARHRSSLGPARSNLIGGSLLRCSIEHLAAGKVRLACEGKKLVGDIGLLAELAKRSAEVRQRCIDLLDAGVEIVRIDSEAGAAVPAAGVTAFTLHLADDYAQLLLADRTTDVQ